MKRYPGIDYRQRPASYCERSNVLHAILSDVKGARRRRLIRDAFHEGGLEALDEDFLKGDFSGDSRMLWELLSPKHMGGEYLPDHKSEEVEIARIELRSTTFDVISIRAKMSDEEIEYSIADEYNSIFTQPIESTSKPLKLCELIKFIEESKQEEHYYPGGLALCFNELNAEVLDRKSLEDFTSINSEFYPQLSEHFVKVYHDWANQP